AGDPAGLDALVAELEEEGVRVRRIPVDYASHTSHVELIEDELTRLLAGVEPREAVVPFYSTVEGRWLEGPELDAGYWYRNLRQPVRFADAVRSLAEQDTPVWVEISAHPVLAHGVVETLESVGVRAHAVTGTLRRDDGGLDRFLYAAAELHVRGTAVHWTPFLENAPRLHPGELPTYPFQHRHYWLASAPATLSTGPAMDIDTSTTPATTPDTGDTGDSDTAAAFARRLRDSAPEEREALLLDFVRAEAAAVLGHESSDQVAPDGVFFDIGFVSLTAVALRNQLQTGTGLELPALLIFDEPTPALLAHHLAELLAQPQNAQPQNAQEQHTDDEPSAVSGRPTEGQ
ncbi:acyltransferase domain-containing protein, partial [Streptomyces ziwulingensis]|uniref:acyltransferase domain-containing protein n=1 Tax=Streptomyces ziwulingensis TaxID=1045501 RepID=UPI0031EDF26A